MPQPTGAMRLADKSARFPPPWPEECPACYGALEIAAAAAICLITKSAADSVGNVHPAIGGGDPVIYYATQNAAFETRNAAFLAFDACVIWNAIGALFSPADWIGIRCRPAESATVIDSPRWRKLPRFPSASSAPARR